MRLWKDIEPLENAPWRGAFRYISRYSYFDQPSIFSRVLATKLKVDPGKSRIIDVGSATGIIGLYALIAKKAAYVTFTDVIGDGISESRCNVIRQLERRRITATQVGFFGPTPFEEIDRDLVAEHTIIAFNPPQLPLDYLDKADKATILADKTMRYYRSGGNDGLETVRTFLQWYSDLKAPRPDLVINLSSFLGRVNIEETLRSRGFEWEIEATRVPLRLRLTPKIATLRDDQIKDKSLKHTIQGTKSIWTKQLLTIFIKGRS